MVEVGRLAAIDPSAAETLAALTRGGFYERYLALQACFGSRDADHVLQALADPSRGIRALAATLVPLVCNDAQARSALERIARPQRSLLLRQLQKRRRQAPIDAYVEERAAADDPALPLLLPFASPPIVERLLPPLAERMERGHWTRLARRRPLLAAAALDRRLEAAPVLDSRLLWQCNGALVGLGERDPDRAVALATTLAARSALDRLELGQVARRRPAAVARLVLAIGDAARVAPERFGRARRPHPFDRAVAELSNDEVVAMLDRGLLHLNYGAAGWLRRLPRDRRAALLDRIDGGLRAGSGVLDPQSVALLPATRRVEEARRQVAEAPLAGEPEYHLRFAAYLPWAEALTALEPFLLAPMARRRSAALHALTASIRYQRERAPDLLALLHARRNEQDRVRSGWLHELAATPPGRWRAEQLPALDLVLRDALDAADLSAQTAGSLAKLLIRLLPFHAAWAAKWLAVLAREQGNPRFWDVGDSVPPAAASALEQALLPVLAALERQEREEDLIALATRLGRRLRGCEHLPAYLERIARQTPSAEHAQAALALLARWQRGRLAALIPELLAQDSSVGTLPAVYTYLHRFRQDLLTPLLSGRRFRGRFNTGRTRFVPPFDGAFYRWTPRQQAAFASALADVIADPDRDAPTVLKSIRRLAALPAAAPDRLIAFAEEGPEERVLTLTLLRRGTPPGAPPRQRSIPRRDAALRALGRLDGGAGVPTLVAALGDDRARVAIYALRRAILDLPAERALAILRAAPLERVTVAKEVVRLLGDIGDERAYQQLLALAAQSLHRDVRIALLRGLWPHLERAESWRLLDQATADANPALASAAGRVPAAGLSRWAQDRLFNLLDRLLTRPEPAVRAAVLLRLRALPAADTERRLLPRLLALLASIVPGEARAAAAALFSMYAERDISALAAAVRGLRTARQALNIVVSALRLELSLSRRMHGAAARAVLAQLAGDPLLAALRVNLAMQALAGAELAQFLRALDERGEFHDGAFLAALDSLSVNTMGGRNMAFAYITRMGLPNKLRSKVYREVGGFRGEQRDLAALVELEAGLATNADPRLRRLALQALLEQTDDHRGWDAERLDRLRRFSADPAPLVAEPALNELAALEEEQRSLS